MKELNPYNLEKCVSRDGGLGGGVRGWEAID